MVGEIIMDTEENYCCHHKFKLLKNKHILVTAKKYFIGVDISLIKSGRFRTI